MPQDIAHPAYLIGVEVLGDRGLRIVLQERTGHGPPRHDPEVGFAYREIVQEPEDLTFEITWGVVACFAVRGDPFPAGEVSTSTIREVEPDDKFMQWVKSDSHSHPDYVAAMAGEEQNGRELRHWIVSCNEAQFDVAALDPPVVERL